MFFLRPCCDASTVVSSAMDDVSVLPGASDLIVVKHKNGKLKKTLLLVCFGPLALLNGKSLGMVVNNNKVQDLDWRLDTRGFVQPQQIPDKWVRKLGLNFGVNEFTFQLGNASISAEIHYYTDNDRLLVSDVDGTVTKNDICGHIHNFVGKDYLHQGYADLIKAIGSNGYKIVWLTMRSISLYDYSKNYLRATVGKAGALLMQPENFVPALTKELRKKTGDIKTNIMNMVRDLFPSNPFVGGLGNRENDAIAYLQAGVALENIFIIDTSSNVQQMNNPQPGLTYRKMTENIANFFPPFNAPKVGY